MVNDLNIAGWVDANDDGEFQSEEFEQSRCCFDFDGDGEKDNKLGDVIILAGSLGDGLDIPGLNAQLQESIDDGSLIIIFEHMGLDDLVEAAFDINFLFGELDSVESITGDGSATNPVLIDPQSFDEGSYPQAQIPDAALAEGAVTAGPGNARLQLDLLGAQLSLAIRQVQIRSTVPDTPESGLDDKGVFLQEGELGGFATIADLYDALNGFASTCECYGLEEGETLISYDENDPVNTDLVTCADVETDTCDDTCGTIAQYCSSAVPIIAGQADLDSDGDGVKDSITVGLTFTAAGADITGVASGQ